jgi:hypothetical protein
VLISDILQNSKSFDDADFLFNVASSIVSENEDRQWALAVRFLSGNPGSDSDIAHLIDKDPSL